MPEKEVKMNATKTEVRTRRYTRSYCELYLVIKQECHGRSIYPLFQLFYYKWANLAKISNQNKNNEKGVYKYIMKIWYSNCCACGFLWLSAVCVLRQERFKKRVKETKDVVCIYLKKEVDTMHVFLLITQSSVSDFTHACCLCLISDIVKMFLGLMLIYVHLFARENTKECACTDATSLRIHINLQMLAL